MELGLKLDEHLQEKSCKPQQPPMEEEKKCKGVGDPLKIFLEKSLE